MKIQYDLLRAALLLLIAISCEPKSPPIEITGSLAGFDEGVPIALLDFETRKRVDSTTLKKGSFYLKGLLASEPERLLLTVGENGTSDFRSVVLYSANEKIRIFSSKENFEENLRVQGSIHHFVKSSFDKEVASIEEDREALLKKMFELRNAGKWNDSLQDAYWGKNGSITIVDHTYDQVQRCFIKNNTNSYYGLHLLASSKKYQSESFIKERLSLLVEPYKTSENAQMLGKFLKTKPLKIGERYVDFKAEDQNGTIALLSQSIDPERFTLLEFYSPYCSWCIASVPYIKELENTYKADLQVVSININEDRTKWLNDYRAHRLNRTSFLLDGGTKSDPYLKYNIDGTPTYFLINSEGIIIKKWTGFDEGMLQSIVNKIKNTL